MRRYSPGASIHDDYRYVCDCCEKDDGQPVLVWHELPERKGHFALCYECLCRLNFEYNKTPNPEIVISRIVITEHLRNKIFERDGHKCVKCGSTKDLQLDHIVPFSKGGITEEKNLQTLCKPCNLRKRDKES